jgi:hypothetical protein
MLRGAFAAGIGDGVGVGDGSPVTLLELFFTTRLALLPKPSFDELTC